MYAAQTIIDVIITEIITELTAVTGEVITGAGLTVKDTSGQVVTLESGVNGDRKYSGLDDSKGTYFYIRINGNITEGRKPANTKRGSCGIESEIRIPLKLVIQHRCADPRKLLDVVKSALFTANLKQNWLYNIVNVKLYPTSSNVLPWDVYNSETGNEAKTMNSLLQIVSTDFELRFDFNYNNKCDDFNLCNRKIIPERNGGIPPSNTSPPVILGKNLVGALIKVIDDGTWTGTLPITFNYQWKRNGSNIIGETNSTYNTVLADLGNTIACLVTATNLAGSANAISNSILIQ
jgi:hypothetical protein